MDLTRAGRTRLSIDSQLSNENSFGAQEDTPSNVPVTAVLAAGRLLRPLRTSHSSRRRRASSFTDSLAAAADIIGKNDVTAKRYLEARRAVSFQTKEYQEHPGIGWMPSLDFYKYLAINPTEEPAEGEAGARSAAKEGPPSCVPPPSPHLQLRMPVTVIINGFDVQCYFTNEEGYLVRKDEMPTVAMCELIAPRGTGLGADGTPVAILKYQKGRGKHHLNLIQQHDLQRQLETARHTQSLCGVQQYIDCQGTKVCVARLHWKAGDKGCMVYKITNEAGKVLGGEELAQRKARLAAESKPTFYQSQGPPSPPPAGWVPHLALPSQVSASTLSASLPHSVASPKGPLHFGATLSLGHPRLHSAGARQPHSGPLSPRGRGARFESDLGSEVGSGGTHGREAEDADGSPSWEEKKAAAVLVDNYVTNHALLHGVSITKVGAGGKIWQEPMEMAQRIVRYVDRRHLARHGRHILELVADFIKDTQGAWWFIEVKAFILSEPTARVRPPKPGPPLRRKGCCGDYCFALEALEEIMVQQEQASGDRPSRPHSAGHGGLVPADANNHGRLHQPGEERYHVSFRVIVEDRSLKDEMAKPQWYYWLSSPGYSASSMGGEWVAYEEADNLAIERAAAMGHTHAKLTPKVSISFKAMQQYELGSHRSSDIRREPPMAELSPFRDRPASAQAARDVKPSRQVPALKHHKNVTSLYDMVPVCGVCFRIYLYKESLQRHRTRPRLMSPVSSRSPRPRSPLRRDQPSKPTTFFLGHAVTALEDASLRSPRPLSSGRDSTATLSA